jgi:SAM-dependent methyltransferase
MHGSPFVEELWRAIRDRPVDDAVTAFCRAHDCSRFPYAADVKFLYPTRPDGTTLVLGAGLGDESLAAGAISIVPSLTHARIVYRHLLDRTGGEPDVAAMPHIRRLPLADGSVDAVILDDDGAAAFGLDDGGLAEAAAEWRRVLAPGGAMVLGLRGAPGELPGLRRIGEALTGTWRTESLDRRIKRSAAPVPGAALSPTRSLRTMRRLGFAPPSLFAPLPDAENPSVVLPLDDAQSVRYFLDNLVRKNSATVRAALGAARLSARLGLFRRLVPCSILVFRTHRVE